MKRLALLAAAIFAISGCRRAGASVRIGSKNFSEQVLLAEIVAQALEAKGLRVDRRLNLGGTFVCHKALVAGDLDLYPEYTGTAFTAILAKKPVADPAAVRKEVESEYAKRWGIVWSPPLGFENTFALVVRGEDARRWGLKTISDLKAHEAEIRPGFGYEFLEREDGFPGLAKTYGLNFPRRPAQMDLGLLLSGAPEPSGGPDRGQLDGRPDRRARRRRARGRPALLSAIRGGVRRQGSGLEDERRGARSPRGARRKDLRRHDAKVERAARPRQAPPGGRGEGVPQDPCEPGTGRGSSVPDEAQARALFLPYERRLRLPRPGRARPSSRSGGSPGRRPFPGRCAGRSRGGPRRRGCGPRRRRARGPGSGPRRRGRLGPRRPRA